MEKMSQNFVLWLPEQSVSLSWRVTGVALGSAVTFVLTGSSGN